MLCMDTMVMDIIWDMPTMDTMDTHMLTMDITMARDLLMLSQRPRLMLMLLSSTELMDMPPTHTPMDMLTMDTMDTHMLTTHMLTMARDPLMLSQRPRLMLTLTTDTTDMLPTHTPMDTTDMPTTDTTDMPAHTVMLTGDKM